MVASLTGRLVRKVGHLGRLEVGTVAAVIVDLDSSIVWRVVLATYQFYFKELVDSLQLILQSKIALELFERF